MPDLRLSIDSGNDQVEGDAYADWDETVTVDADAVVACFADAPDIDDPRHRYRTVRLEALTDGRLLDSVAVLDGGREACAAYAQDVDDVDFTPDEGLTECLGEPDVALNCDPALAASFPSTGDRVVLTMEAVVGPGDVIEVRDAAACDDPGPVLVSISGNRAFDEPHIVIGEVAGPVGRIVVPDEAFE